MLEKWQKMKAVGHKVDYYENIQGVITAGKLANKRAKRVALRFMRLWTHRQ